VLAKGRANSRQGELPLRGDLAHAGKWSAQELYEGLNGERGEMENRMQLNLFSDRLSAETLHANQLRLYFTSLA